MGIVCIGDIEARVLPDDLVSVPVRVEAVHEDQRHLERVTELFVVSYRIRDGGENRILFNCRQMMVQREFKFLD